MREVGTRVAPGGELLMVIVSLTASYLHRFGEEVPSQRWRRMPKHGFLDEVSSFDGDLQTGSGGCELSKFVRPGGRMSRAWG